MACSAALRFLVLGLLGSWQTIRADAFLDVNGIFTTINVPGAEPGTTVASGINNLGQIVGTFSDSSGSPEGFLDTNGVFTTINVPGATDTFLAGINDMDQIVGTYFTGSQPLGFLYANGSFTTIDVPGSLFTQAFGINNSGEIVGVYVTGSSGGGFLYAGGVFTTVDEDGATFPALSGINNAGTAVGVSFVYDNGVVTTINFPFPGAEATGINASGQIVGDVVNCCTVLNGFLDTNGVFQFIDVPGGSMTSPDGINDAGEIVGSFTPVPEPASLLLIASGLTGIIVLKRRRRSWRVRH